MEADGMINQGEPSREWWDKRSLRYIFFALGCAVVGFLAFAGLMSLPGMLGRGEDAVEPMGLCCGSVLLPAFAGLGYRIGFPVEKYLWQRKPDRHWAPVLYKLGLLLTLGIFFLPAAMALIAFVEKR